MTKVFNSFADLHRHLVADVEMRLWHSGNYGNELSLTLEDAQACSHPGDNEPAVRLLMQKPYVAEQLRRLDPATLAKELREYGAWDDKELADHDVNLMRWVWLACGDIVEEHRNVS